MDALEGVEPKEVDDDQVAWTPLRIADSLGPEPVPDPDAEEIVGEEIFVACKGMFRVCPIISLSQSSPGLTASRLSKEQPSLSAMA